MAMERKGLEELKRMRGFGEGRLGFLFNILDFLIMNGIICIYSKREGE